MANHQENHHLNVDQGTNGVASSSRGSWASLRDAPKPETQPQQAAPQESQRTRNNIQRRVEVEELVEDLGDDGQARHEGRTSLR